MHAMLRYTARVADGGLRGRLLLPPGLTDTQAHALRVEARTLLIAERRASTLRGDAAGIEVTARYDGGGIIRYLHETLEPEGATLPVAELNRLAIRDMLREAAPTPPSCAASYAAMRIGEARLSSAFHLASQGFAGTALSAFVTRLGVTEAGPARPGPDDRIDLRYDHDGTVHLRAGPGGSPSAELRKLVIDDLLRRAVKLG
jgi:hypothetical protein